MLSFIWWLIIGLIAGALARLIMPGRDPMGIIATILLGIVGSIIGGFGGLAISGTNDGRIHTNGLIIFITRPVPLLLVLRHGEKRRTCLNKVMPELPEL